MSLTQQDKTDLMGLVSGFGTPQSDARAHHLVEGKPEAAEFVRQMRTIAKAFSPPQVAGARMCRRDAVALAAGIRANVASPEKGLVRGKQSRRRWYLAWAGAAAATVLLALGTTWIVLRTRARSAQDSPYVTLISGTWSLTDVTVDQTRERLRAGDRIQPKKDFAALVFADGTRAVIRRGSDVILGREDHTITLSDGEVFVYSPGEMKVLGVDTITQLYAAKAHLTASKRRLMWDVHEGTAVVTIRGQAFKIIAGQSGVWETTDTAIGIQPLTGTILPWAAKGLDVPLSADP